MFSNFEPSSKLVTLLKEALDTCRGTSEDAWNREKLEEIIRCNHECRAQFDLESWESDRRRMRRRKGEGVVCI